MRRIAAVLGIVAAAGLSFPAQATTETLVAPAFGVVDFGDSVDFRVEGSGCGSASTRVRVVSGSEEIEGPSVTRCSGTASVPTFSQVRATGWRQGDPIEIQLVSDAGTVPLRYQRTEVDEGEVALGQPKFLQPGTDPETGPHDGVVIMNTGDSIDLGRVDLTHIDSVSIRMCLPQTEENETYFASEVDAPLRLSITQESPIGPTLVGPIDGSSNPTTFFRLQSFGFGDSCWRLAVFPLSGEPALSAPHVFLNVLGALPDTFVVNSVDFNGTGARSDAPNWAAPDPAGMTTIFDGTSFDGWTQTGCLLRNGAATVDRSSGNPAEIADCSMTHGAAGADRVIRLEVRREHFYDNGGIFPGPTEVQLRSAGEFLPGGYFMEYAARWQKLNSWPTWSQMEIIQLGSRYIVRVNGRTVTDHTALGGVPGSHQLRLVAQPTFSHRVSDGVGMGNELQAGPGDVPPELATPSEWGRFWFRNVRVFDCDGPDDPACTALADVNAGQTFRD